MSWEIRQGDCIELMRAMPEGSAQTCVTSPPYWGLRDYGHSDQLGLEDSPELYVERIVDVFREVRRVLRDDGTLWLNLGDTWNSYNANRGGSASISDGRDGAGRGHPQHRRGLVAPNLKAKDMIGVPWMVAFALRADGWFLRSEVIWHKPNPMPESIHDRPTQAHERIFLLTKGPRYYYDADAIREPDGGKAAGNGYVRPESISRGGRGQPKPWTPGNGRNKRSVWTVNPTGLDGAHFATFPIALIEPCILAGAANRIDDEDRSVVIDPFAGSGTTGLAAMRHGRSFVGCELNPTYVELARRRIRDDAPLFNAGAEVVA